MKICRQTLVIQNRWERRWSTIEDIYPRFLISIPYRSGIWSQYTHDLWKHRVRVELLVLNKSSRRIQWGPIEFDRSYKCRRCRVVKWNILLTAKVADIRPDFSPTVLSAISNRAISKFKGESVNSGNLTRYRLRPRDRISADCFVYRRLIGGPRNLVDFAG